jgi:hypothetical protein
MAWVFIEDREYGSSFEFDPFSFKERKGKVDDGTFPMESTSWSSFLSKLSYTRGLS